MAEGAPPAAAPGAWVVARSADAFGADLHLLLAAAGGGTVFSPASVATALRLALLGSRGRTAAELAGALHAAVPAVPGGQPGEEPGGARGPGREAVGGPGPVPGEAAAGPGGLAGPGVTFSAPAMMWVQAGLPLRSAFTTAAGRLDWASVAEADFAHAPEDARRAVNAAIAAQTGGRITGLLVPGAVGALTRLVLASAVYLRAAWAEPFPPGATRPAPFHPDGGGETAVPMMTLRAGLAYLRGDGYQAVVLPYLGHRLAMAVLLPDGPLPALEERLPEGGVHGLIAGAVPHRVQLRLPKFRQDASTGLVPALRRLGVSEAFGDGADFSGVTADAAGLAIADVAHRAFVGVDEWGTEAAAATATVMRAAAFSRPSGPLVEMTVDRPFLFAIIATATVLPLFLGRVTLPSGQAGGTRGQ